MKKFRIGVLGCGEISAQYLKSAKEVFSDILEVSACSDIVMEKAKARAEGFSVPKSCAPGELFNDPEIDIIVNLTVPKVHEELTIESLKHGKHVYSEKPFALTLEGARNIIDIATQRRLRVGCAPDSFLSAPMQTAKKTLESGWIGKPVGFTAICPLRGNEYHRPDADFFYQKGAGPIYDMAPYYLNALINLLGPVKSVVAKGKITFPERTIKVPPRRGDTIKVEVPTYVACILEFGGGIFGTFTNSFDIWKSKQPNIEIFGEKGTMVLPDPNMYSGDVLISRYKDTEWRICPQFNEYSKHMRGVGIADMAKAIMEDRAHRANADMACHAVEIMKSMAESSADGVKKEIISTCVKPAGLWESEDTILWK